MNNKKLLCIISITFLVFAFVISNLNTQYFISTYSGLSTTPKIILDAGHGGFDGGAIAGDGTVEKDINLKITLYLYDILTTNGYNVILTRQTDTGTEDSQLANIPSRKKSDMKNRLELMNKNKDAIFISIHLNKFTTSAARGSQIFYSPNDNHSKILGDYIQNCIVTLLQKDNSRVNKKATKSTYLLYNATIPAVLVECGFLSNKAELEELKNERYQKKIAFCIFCGINNYFLNIKEI